jgi:hypothetical protein
MFAACSRPETVAEVGRLGLGALNFAFGTDDYLAEKVAEYRRAGSRSALSARTSCRISRRMPL